MVRRVQISELTRETSVTDGDLLVFERDGVRYGIDLADAGFGGSFTAATAAQIAALSGANPITPTGVGTLLEGATPSGGSNYAPTFGTRRRAEWIITANRVLSNPTGGVPGATFEVTIKSSTATERTVTFGTYYKGSLPTVVVTDSAFVTLFIYCISSTQFLVSDKAWSP